VITWQQLGFHQKPIGLLNTEGFFDPLLAAFDAFIQEVRVSVCVWGGGG
jgi:predicted Rossmann-fold nucleotide-binding protein